MLTLKIGTIKVSGQSGQIGQTSHINRSDRSIQVCQIANWTEPLRRSRRDDRNAYIEHPIRSPDERVMPSGRPAPRSDRSRDQSDRSETPSPSYELYFDTGFDRVSTPNGYRPPHPIYMKGHGRLREIPIDSHIYPLLFSANPNFSNLICCSSLVSTAFDGVLSGLPTSE